MPYKQRYFRQAFTLLEAMITTMVLGIIAISSLNFQYFAAQYSKTSRGQITATRTAQLLLEDWMSTGGSEDYNPADLKLGFSPIHASPSDLGKYSELGACLRDTLFTVTIDGFPMLVTLLHKDVAYDEAAEVKLRQLCVCVSFAVVSDKQAIQSNEKIKPVILTTYVRVDAGGG